MVSSVPVDDPRRLSRVNVRMVAADGERIQVDYCDAASIAPGWRHGGASQLRSIVSSSAAPASRLLIIPRERRSFQWFPSCRQYLPNRSCRHRVTVLAAVPCLIYRLGAPSVPTGTVS